MGSEKLFRKECTRVQFPIWLRGSVHISVHVLRRVAAGISSSLCIKRHSFGQFHSLTYINRWCWLLHNQFYLLQFIWRHDARKLLNYYYNSLSLSILCVGPTCIMYQHNFKYICTETAYVLCTPYYILYCCENEFNSIK